MNLTAVCEWELAHCLSWLEESISDTDTVADIQQPKLDIAAIAAATATTTAAAILLPMQMKSGASPSPLIYCTITYYLLCCV